MQVHYLNKKFCISAVVQWDSCKSLKLGIVILFWSSKFGSVAKIFTSSNLIILLKSEKQHWTTPVSAMLDDVIKSLLKHKSRW